uniref:Uncharacterized protein n=1 Tax=Sphaerodactylus townsendi TaxID=933632 RepID=A0ACB8ESG9_9SAUR
MECVVHRNRGLEPHELVSFYLAISGFIYLLLIMINGLIIVVNLMDWSKGRSLMPNDEILSSLALFNLLFATLLILDYYLSLNWEEFYSTFYNVQRVMLTLDIITSCSSFWCTAWLSVFYCVKIVNFKQAFLLRLKLKFPGLVRWLLLGSTSVSLGAAVLLQWAITTAMHKKKATDLTNQTTSLPPTFNCTHNYGNIETIVILMSPHYRVLIVMLSCSIPLMVVVCSLVLVLYSLFRHTQKLGQNLPPSQLKAHVNAAKTVLSLLLCYVAQVISQTLARFEIYRNWYYEYFLCLTVQLATLLAQNTILSRSNPKLKQTAVWLLSCLPGRHRKENGRRPTELPEVQGEDQCKISVTVRPTSKKQPSI